MSFSLLPRAMFDRLTDIRPEWLKERGVELLLLDFDNTIVPYTTSVPEPAVTAWFSEVLGAGIQLCIVSNSLRAAAFGSMSRRSWPSSFRRRTLRCSAR